MVSNASDDFPDPDNPVTTVSLSRGIVTSMFRRLCSRAPRTMRASSAIARESCGPDRCETRSLYSVMPHTDAIIVLSTLASDEEAVTFVRALLDRRLIACGTIFPASRSLYRWQGKIADEREVVVLLKTRAARLDSLRTAFTELHPYKVPELLALPVEAGLDKYLDWINGETTLALA